MKKIRILSFIIAAVLLAELLPPAAFEVKAAGDYYEITDVKGLKKIKDDLSGTYVLKNDISMGWNSWEPVGDEEHPFTGRFEGNGHVIFGLKVEAVSQDGNALAGFFGYTAHAVISNLCLMDATVRASTFNNTENRCFASAGGIVGSINESTVIDRCCFYGTIEAEGGEMNYARTGGIAAGVHSGSVVSDCFACADLICSSGTANAMAGGICAWVSDSTVQRCYFEGNISIPDDCYSYAGGINASGNKDGFVEGCVSASDSVFLQAAGTDHCVYNPVGCFAGEYSDNAYSGNIITAAEIIGDSSAQRINDERMLCDKGLYESLGWEFGPGGWIDTYRYPRLAGVGRRIIIGKDTLSFKNNYGIDYEEYFDVIYPGETDMSNENLRGQMNNNGLCFGMCALTEVLLHEDTDDILEPGDEISSLDPSSDEVFGLRTWQAIRYLHVMQYDNDYTGLDDCATMEGVFKAVRSYAEGESDEVPLLKVKSEAWWVDHGHVIIGIDYNEYNNRTEILCYDPNSPSREKVLTLKKASNGRYESWHFYMAIFELSSKKNNAILKYYEQPSRIYNDLIEESSSFLTRQEIQDRHPE